MRSRLEEIRRQELEGYQSEFGPLPESQERALEELTTRTIERIADMLGRELRETPEVPEQDYLAAAVQRLFKLTQPAGALRTQN